MLSIEKEIADSGGVLKFEVMEGGNVGSLEDECLRVEVVDWMDGWTPYAEQCLLWCR